MPQHARRSRSARRVSPRKARRSATSLPLPAPLVFVTLRKLKFPQTNNGSSTGLALARIGLRHVLLFLTQKPGSEPIFFMNPNSGAVLRSIDPQYNSTIGSLEWVRNSIRVANVSDPESGWINTIHPSTGGQIGAIQVPAGRGEGMAYDGAHLYYSTISRIHEIHPTTGHVYRSFASPGGPCYALAYGNGRLFSGNRNSSVITIFDRQTLAIRGYVTVSGIGPTRVDGLAYHRAKKELFVADQSLNTIFVGRVRPGLPHPPV